jgi:E1A-binding protein p400
VNQTSSLRPSQANQSIVNVLTKPRPNSNVRLQLFPSGGGGESSGSSTIPSQTSPTKSPVKRLLPSTPEKKDTYAAKLQRIMNHRIVRSKLIKEKYNEHLMEAYFLEAGGNILDLYQFAKKPKSHSYLAYLKEHAIDPKENVEEQTIPQTVPSTPTATAASSLPGISHTQSNSTTTSTPLTNHNQELKMNSSKVKTSANHQNISNQEQIVEKARQEAYVVQRITDLQKEGLWSEKRLPKVQEMHRAKAHWDFLLEEMVWLAADFAQERKWKKAAAKKCARMVQKYFQDKALAAQRAEKAQEQHLRRIAAFCAKEIRNFWNNVEKLVEYKQHTILEEKRKKALDQQLSFIVDQTEKYSQLLAEGMNRTNTDNVPASAVSSRSVSRANSDDEFHPDSHNSTDDEETIEQEEAAGGETADHNEEVAALQRESEMDLDDFLKELPKDYLQNRDSIRLSDLSGSEDVSENEDKRDAKSSKSDEDFSTANVSSDEDDEDTIQEQEQAEGEQNHQQELDDLKTENDMSIEELRRKYSGLPPPLSDNDDDMKMSEESEESEHSVGYVTDDSDENDIDSDMDVSENESQGEGDDLGLKSLLEDSHNEGEDTKTDKNNDLINDAAAIAESIQPKGNTLSSTNVSTKVPFLLKLPLREYQHIGLDWLVTMYERKLNGILADEMGLGKTIQTIALLTHLACEKENWGPHLIVVPTSVMLNWEMECKKWSPAFKILTYYGTQKERKMKRTGWTKPNAFHICITSYKLVIQDHQSFRRKKWKYLILDEAQNIKNFKSQRWQLLLNFQTQQRLLLTGTPLQNNLMELWSLMHFLMPNVFQSHREFKEWFSNPVTGMIEGNSEYNENIIKRLHKVLRPFLLRRLKSEVEKQMPKKYEHVIMCRLSKRQRFLYDDYMSRAKTRETLASGNLLSVINVLMQLRKVCNHPNLFEVRPTISPFLCDGIIALYPSLVYSILEYDIWKHIDLSWLNLNLIFMEFQLSAYQSYRMKQLRTPRKIIEINSVSESIPPPPPCRLVMRIKKQDDIKMVHPIKMEKKDVNGKNPQTQSNIKVKMPQYGVQLVQQGIVKAIPVNISQPLLANQPGATVSVASMLKPSDKISASFAQLVQTSTGKHLLLTPNPSISGNIPVSTTTPGGQKLTFLSKQPLLTAGNSSHQITKAFMKIQLTSVAATTTNTITTMSATSTVKPDEKDDRKTVGSKFIDQLYANQSNNLDVRWDSDCVGNDIGSCDEMDLFKDELKTRLKIMAQINERRCSAVPLYGEDFRRVVTVFDKYSNIISSWKSDESKTIDTECDSNQDMSTCIKDLVHSPERRIKQMADICDRFIFYVPAVRAPEPQMKVWHPPPSTYWGEHEQKKKLASLLSGPATALHRIASAMVTQFPDPRLIQYDCGKLQTLDKLLRRLKSEGHRVLIFTQMTKMLDVLEAFLNFHGHIYLRLDGTTKVDQRQLLMERFNGDTRIFVFILSTRSGGIGVNLTGADTVIFYDSDWNPTMDAQAQDRCHRIGQTRDVHIYRLVSERTIEENILKKANQKRLLGDLAIEGGNFTTAYFKSSTIQDLFNIDANEESAANRMSEVVDSKEKRAAAVADQSQAQVGGDDKVALGALENALAACEDDQDVQAARTAKAEAVADLAEFDENIPLDDQEKEPEMSKAEQEIDNVIKKLSPIERYAMKFIEETESAWSAEQLAAAEREIEEQKREWEQNRLAAMREEEERRARELEEENDLLTFSREDATNQVSSSKTKKVNNTSTAKKLVHKKRAMKNRQQTCNKSPRSKKLMKKMIQNKYTSDRSIAKAKLTRKRYNRRRLTRQSTAKKEDTNTEDSDDSQCSKSVDYSLVSRKINGDTDSSIDDHTDDQSESDSRSIVLKTPTNHVDNNSPRTRSRGTVAINLWTLDVSPILPGVKPVKNSPSQSVKRIKSNSVEKDLPKDKSDDEVHTKSVVRSKKRFAKKKVEGSIPEIQNHDDEGNKNSETDEKVDANDDTSSDTKTYEIPSNNSIPKGKICKVMLSDIISGGQYTLMTSSELRLNESDSANEVTVDMSEGDSERTSTEAESSVEKVYGVQETSEEDPVADVESKTEKPSVANNKSDLTHIDNGLDDHKNCSKKKLKLNVKNKKLSKCHNNKTLDDWITRSPPVHKTSTVNSKKIDDCTDNSSEDLNDSSLKRTCSDAELNDSDLGIQSKVIKTE